MRKQKSQTRKHGEGGIAKTTEMMMASSSSSDDRGPFWIQRFRSSENDIRRRAVIVASAVMLALATLLMALYICINLRRCRRRRRSAFTAGGLGGAHPEDPASPGLHPAAIQRLPVTIIPAKMESRDYAEAQMTLTECSICISELRGGHNARVLPACGHVFHVECIDTWLLSHSTCPLCRNAVVVPTDPTPPPPPTVSADRSPASTSVSASAAASMSVPADVAIDVGADVAVVGPPEGGETRQPSLSSSSGRWGVGRIVSRDRNGGSGRVYPEPYVAAHDSSVNSDVAAHDSSTSSP